MTDSLAHYSFNIKNKILYVSIAGVFTLKDAQEYDEELKQNAAKFNEKWCLIADVNKLQASPLEAVNYVESLTLWLVHNDCIAIINVHNNHNPIVDYQLNIASGYHKVFRAKTISEAVNLANSLLSPQT